MASPSLVFLALWKFTGSLNAPGQVGALLDLRLTSLERDGSWCRVTQLVALSLGFCLVSKQCSGQSKPAERTQNRLRESLGPGPEAVRLSVLPGPPSPGSSQYTCLQALLAQPGPATSQPLLWHHPLLILPTREVCLAVRSPVSCTKILKSWKGRKPLRKSKFAKAGNQVSIMSHTLRGLTGGQV